MEDTHKRKLTRKVIDTPNGDNVTGDSAMGPWAKGCPNGVLRRITQLNAVFGLWCVRLKLRFDTNCPSCILFTDD